MDTNGMTEKLKKTLSASMENAVKEITEKLNKTVIEEMEKAKKEMVEKLNKALTEEIKKAKEVEMAEKLKKTVIDKMAEEMAEKLKKTAIDKMAEEMYKMEKAMKEMAEEMDEKRCEIEDLEQSNSVLHLTVRASKDEIRDARNELIMALRESLGGESCKIGVKMMGDLDKKPFLKACKQMFSGKEAEMQSAMLCSKWEENLRNPSWHPFKCVENGDNVKEVVDEEDEKLRNLREEWGEEVMNAVMTAHKELNDFNASGSYSVPALWNYEEGRKATLKEGIAHMANQISTLKLKRKRT